MSLLVRLARASVVCSLSVACGGSQGTAATAPPPPETSATTSVTPEPAPTSEPAPPVESAPSSADGESASAADEADAMEEDSSPPPALASDRTVKYMVSPEGLRVVVDGVTFTPKAELVRSGSGWGVKLDVQARTQGDTARSLLAPSGSELAFAGQVRRKDSSAPEEFSDRRDGDREVTLRPGKGVKLSRAWPPKEGPKPIGPGDELTIEVGLWGLGADASSRRPVGKFCRIEVKFDKEKPRVKVTAPVGVPK